MHVHAKFPGMHVHLFFADRNIKTQDGEMKINQKCLPDDLNSLKTKLFFTQEKKKKSQII